MKSHRSRCWCKNYVDVRLHLPWVLQFTPRIESRLRTQMFSICVCNIGGLLERKLEVPCDPSSTGQLSRRGDRWTTRLKALFIRYAKYEKVSFWIYSYLYKVFIFYASDGCNGFPPADTDASSGVWREPSVEHRHQSSIMYA